MVAQSEVFLLNSQPVQPVAAESAPVVKPFKVGARFAEKLQLHLLKLTCAEGEVAGGYLVSEGLAYLTYAERHLFARGALDIFEIYKNTLRGLRAQVKRGGGILRDALKRLEHKVEFSDICKVGRAAGRADDVLFLYKGKHLLIAPTGGIVVCVVLCGVVLYQLVRAVACFCTPCSPSAGRKNRRDAPTPPKFGDSSVSRCQDLRYTDIPAQTFFHHMRFTLFLSSAPKGP